MPASATPSQPRGEGKETDMSAGSQARGASVVEAIARFLRQCCVFP